MGSASDLQVSSSFEGPNTELDTCGTPELKKTARRQHGQVLEWSLTGIVVKFDLVSIRMSLR